MPKAFIDTNVFVYQLDKRDRQKQIACRRLVRESLSRGDAVISTQVMQEFYVAATTKLSISPVLAKGILHTMESMEVVTVGPTLIGEAIDASIQYKVSFWDALIVVSAESAQCDLLYTEDLNHGQIMRTVRIHDPFA